MQPDRMTAFEDAFNLYKIPVSHETLEKFCVYERLLLKWQKAINLVGPTTLDDVIVRHFVDSAQLFQYIPKETKRLADLGSGAGFPGVILAIMGVSDVHVIESDVRKATFMREVSRETKTALTIHDKRIEDTKIENVDVITARAFSSLKNIVKFASELKAPDHACMGLFLKGENYQQEIDTLPPGQFALETYPSVTEENARIVKFSL